MRSSQYIAILIWGTVFSVSISHAIELSTEQAMKQDCPAGKNFQAVDMRDSFPPLHDQGDKGWCYADGVADQITYWGLKNAPFNISLKNGRYPSAVAVAVTTNKTARSTSLDALASAKKAYDQVVDQLARNIESNTVLDRRKVEFLQKEASALSPEFVAASNQSKGLFKKYWKLHDSKKPEDIKAFQKIEAELGVVEREKEAALSKIPKYAEILQKMKELRVEADVLVEQRTKLSDNFKFQEPDGGNPENVLNDILNHGVCLENEVQSDPSSSDLLTANQVFSSNLSQYLNYPTQQNLCLAASGLANYFKFLGIDEIAEILKKFDSTDALAEIIKGCKKFNFTKSSFIRPQVHPMSPQNDEKLKTDIKDIAPVLDNHIPVGISYDAEVFEKGVIEKTPPYKDSLHYSLLIGKRYNCGKSEPEYLIRNSWGETQYEESREKYISSPDEQTASDHLAARKVIIDGWSTCSDTFVFNIPFLKANTSTV